MPIPSRSGCRYQAAHERLRTPPDQQRAHARRQGPRRHPDECARLLRRDHHARHRQVRPQSSDRPGPPTNRYKNTRPPSTKIATRTGKIRDTVAAIRTTDWDPICLSVHSTSRANLQDTFDQLYSTIRRAEDTCQPLRMTKLKGDKPWMTYEIKALIRERQRLYLQGRLIERSAVANVVTSKIRSAKRKYNARFTATNAWKEINTIRSPKDESAVDQELAINQNNGFYDVWSGMKQPDISSYILPGPLPSCPMLFNAPTIVHSIGKQKSGSSGPDGLPAKLLKAARLELAPVIATLFNACLLLSFVPSQWKKANIVAIPKTSHPKAAADYRPIALTSALCKTFERVLAKHILLLTKEMWQNNKQYGFLPGCNTMDAIVQVIEDWSRAKDRKLPTQAIFFDFAKAFDLVDHKVLLDKLATKLPAWLVSWIAAYLTDRRQRVKAKDFCTEWKPVEAGVIQGSILGPILFLIFIADINSAIPAGIELLKYADDILVYCSSQKWNSPLVQAAADGILRWCADNKMKLNIGKCQELVMLNGCEEPPTATALGLSTIARVKAAKYLGVHLNDDLDWTQQWKLVCKKVCPIPFLLRRLRHQGFKEGVLVSVFRSLVLSHFTYNAPILAQVDQDTLKEMEALQRRALKSIGLDPSAALTRHGIGSIEDHISRHTKNVLNRILSNPNHAVTSKILRTNARSGRPATFKPNKPRTEKYKNSVLQAHLRALRDGVPDLYTNTTTRPALATASSKSAAIKTKSPCPICGKPFINVRAHQTKMNHHNTLQHNTTISPHLSSLFSN